MSDQGDAIEISQIYLSLIFILVQIFFPDSEFITFNLRLCIGMFFIMQIGIGHIRLPYFLPHILAHLVLYLNVGGSSISLYIYAALVILVYILKIKFPGPPSFQANYPQTDTPFEAGYKTVRTTKFGNEVQVFYPVSRSRRQKEQKINPYWLPHDYKSLNAMLMLASKFVK